MRVCLACCLILTWQLFLLIDLNDPFPQFNIGGSVDSDVIFTPDSYLPRHASVNFTFDFLDKSFNIFEVGGDFSGMEDYIERLFGEGGYFENPEIQGLVENLRPKREVQDERIEEFQRMYNDARTLTEEADPEAYDPKASVFFRIFGNEVFYMENLLKADPLQALRDLIREFSVPRSFQVRTLSWDTHLFQVQFISVIDRLIRITIFRFSGFLSYYLFVIV